MTDSWEEAAREAERQRVFYGVGRLDSLYPRPEKP